MSELLTRDNQKKLLIPGKEVFTLIRHFTYLEPVHDEMHTEHGTEIHVCASKEQWLKEIEEDQAERTKLIPLIIKVPIVSVKTVVSCE